jgi:aryl-alcohol dehydrogenase-like predicted oxidoreductase
VRAETDDFARKLYDHPNDQQVAESLRGVAQGRGVPPAQVALAWLLSKPAVTAPIIGATKIDHLQAALAALEITLTRAEVEALEAPYQPHPVRGFV